MITRFIKLSTAICLTTTICVAQNTHNNPTSNHGNKFEQLGTILPTPNEYRTASGAPGSKYWQQRADYTIDATLDEKTQTITGKETVTYYNNSPDKLTYLWLQLDENEHAPTAENHFFDNNKMASPYDEATVRTLDVAKTNNGLGSQIISITNELGVPIPYTINNTMLRIDLPKPLVSKAQVKFNVKWKYKMSNRMVTGGRGGYEYFADENNYIFTVSQWYPRMCVYSDFQGWQNKQFTGRGEFALAFGNFNVKMTVPADHLVCSTGECQNYAQVLTTTQLQRWNKATNNYADITEIVTLNECKANEKTRATATKTWVFKADSVRDFAWGASRKFMWDAMPIKVEGKRTMCMSFYGKEAYAIYRRYSTKAVAHTIKTYSKYTIPYAYPVAQSIEAASGMEYPMICFNFGRAEKDGTYSEATKNGMIGVVIHEVGHNFFPMIINSDERQWSWLDEGLNTFTQFLTEQEFDPNFPSTRGPAHKIVDYMRLPKDQLEPIMVNSENIIHFGPNAYAKPATALNILRETIMGRKLFDFAFKQYCTRWAYKHPEPADFFRTMEDASAVDLDWFWRTWFYDIQPIDVALDSVKTYTLNNAPQVPVKMDTISIKPKAKEFDNISKIHNRAMNMNYLIDVDTSLRDFYYSYVPEVKTEIERKPINKYETLETLTDSAFKDIKGNYYYDVFLSNKGGGITPVIIQWTYVDGTTSIDRISAYVWRKNEFNVSKTFAKTKQVASIQLDPYKETADIDEKNNTWNTAPEPSRFELYKRKVTGRGQSVGGNPMQKANEKK